jgi:hypothetical protein
VSFTRTAWIAFAGGLFAVVVLRVIYALRVPTGGEGSRGMVPARAFGTFVAAVMLGTALLWAPAGAGSDASDGEPETQAGSPPASSTATPLATLEPLRAQGTSYAVVPTPSAGAADIGSRVSSIGNTDDLSIRLRVEYAKQAIRDWRAHPIVGLGIGSFGQRYINPSNEPAWLSNVFVRVLHDSGLVGLALFAGALLVLAWRVLALLRRPRDNDAERVALALAVATVAVFAAFQLTEGLQIAWYWFSLGLFAAALRLAGQPRAQTLPPSVVPRPPR